MPKRQYYYLVSYNIKTIGGTMAFGCSELSTNKPLAIGETARLVEDLEASLEGGNRGSVVILSIFPLEPPRA